MQYQIKYTSPATTRTDCLIIGIFAGKKLTSAASLLNELTNNAISQCLKNGDISGEVGQTLLLQEIKNADGKNLPSKRILLAGLGDPKKLSIAAINKAHTSAGKLISTLNVGSVSSYLTDIDCLALNGLNEEHLLRSAITAINTAFYRYNDFKSDKKTPACKKITFAFEKKGSAAIARRRETGLKQGSAIANGVEKTKDLGNAPANLCTPTYLAKEAKALQNQHKKIKVSILEEKQMKKLGMHSLLSVSNGSVEPAKLIVMEYKQGKKGKKPAVLVGKGITFDTGGISLKPGGQMDEMKYDMCGAASVVGTMQAVAEMELPINLVCVIAAAENMPSGQATKPGDIVKSMSGQTIEILNTDAEGRLVLCDALSYVEKFDPAAVVDIATLTGACIVALGRVPSAVFSNQPKLASQLVESGNTIQDRVWELPIWDDYQQQLDSNFADIANIGGRDAGSITAACFLSRFTTKYNWAHLDIAGTAWVSGKAKGATGRPVPLLTQYLIDNHV